MLFVVIIFGPLKCILHRSYSLINVTTISGIRLKFNGSQPVGSRVVDVTVRCIECDVPSYEPLDLDKYYRVVCPDFIAGGGGGFDVSVISV